MSLFPKTNVTPEDFLAVELERDSARAQRDEARASYDKLQAEYALLAEVNRDQVDKISQLSLLKLHVEELKKRPDRPGKMFNADDARVVRFVVQVAELMSYVGNRAVTDPKLKELIATINSKVEHWIKIINEKSEVTEVKDA